MKPLSVGIVLLATAMAGCGGGSSSQPTTSGIKNRAFVSNAYSGQLDFVDASADTLTGHTIAVGVDPGLMAVTPGRESTLVFDQTTNQVQVVSNSGEKVAGAVQLPNLTESMVAKDANTAFATVLNATVSGQSELGAVIVMNLQNFTISSTIGVPRARRLVLSHNGSTLLVFSDNSNAVTIIDTASSTATTVGGFDQPVSAVFSSDDSRAFVLNCGPECGGTAAGVQPLLLGATPSAGTAVPVSAATVGFLSGSSLIVAGTRAAIPGAGLLTVLDVSSGTPSVTKADIPISDGFHTRMALGSNNKLFIGAINCTNDPNSATPTGCLSIFDTSASTAVIDTARDPTFGAKGFVTGMVPIANRNVVYVVEGGELRVFDTTTSQEIPGKVDIVGQAVDVKAVDQAQ